MDKNHLDHNIKRDLDESLVGRGSTLKERESIAFVTREIGRAYEANDTPIYVEVEATSNTGNTDVDDDREMEVAKETNDTLVSVEVEAKLDNRVAKHDDNTDGDNETDYDENTEKDKVEWVVTSEASDTKVNVEVEVKLEVDCEECHIATKSDSKEANHIEVTTDNKRIGRDTEGEANDSHYIFKDTFIHFNDVGRGAKVDMRESSTIDKVEAVRNELELEQVNRTVKCVETESVKTKTVRTNKQKFTSECLSEGVTIGVTDITVGVTDRKDNLNLKWNRVLGVAINRELTSEQLKPETDNMNCCGDLFDKKPEFIYANVELVNPLIPDNLPVNQPEIIPDRRPDHQPVRRLSRTSDLYDPENCSRKGLVKAGTEASIFKIDK